MNTIDPIVEEIRMYRKEHVALHGNNLHTIVEVLRKKEQESKHIFLNPGTKPVITECVTAKRNEKSILQLSEQPVN